MPLSFYENLMLLMLLQKYLQLTAIANHIISVFVPRKNEFWTHYQWTTRTQLTFKWLKKVPGKKSQPFFQYFKYWLGYREFLFVCFNLKAWKHLQNTKKFSVNIWTTEDIPFTHKKTQPGTQAVIYLLCLKEKQSQCSIKLKKLDACWSMQQASQISL